MISRRVLGTLSLGLAFLGASSLVAGLVLLNRPTPALVVARGPLLTIDPPLLILGDLPHRSRIPLSATLTNHGDRSVKMLGVAGTCSPWGCARATSSTVEIPPGESRPVEMMFYSADERFVGDFSEDVTLYVDSPVVRRLLLRIQGRLPPNPPDS